MRPTPVVTVVRYLLLDRVTFLVLPWVWAAGAFVVDMVILRLTPAGHADHRWVGGLASLFLVVFAVGAQSVARALPFALSLGVSRRTYFLGATSVALAMAVCFGLVVAVGQTLERRPRVFRRVQRHTVDLQQIVAFLDIDTGLTEWPTRVGVPRCAGVDLLDAVRAAV